MSSTVPAVLADLYSKAQTANPNAQVIYGSPLNNMQPDYICIGHSEQAGSVVITQDTDDMANKQDAEAYEVYGQAVSWRGSAEESQDTITAAFAMADALEAAVRADRTLSGNAVFAHWIGGPVEILQTNKGPVTAIHFTVSVDAQRT